MHDARIVFAQNYLADGTAELRQRLEARRGAPAELAEYARLKELDAPVREVPAPRLRAARGRGGAVDV
jgi:hypothetical protein